mmetsp:Transcript_46142/g.113216  ORF Transcript_46142/g.113216 Transcript_46142/m.113216 type:complete len:115 (+) Transcript_46142:41-385(+)
MSSPAAIFDQLSARVKSDPSLVKQVKGVYLFVVKEGGSDKKWTVDLKNGAGSIAQGDGAKPDCTITMKQQDFMDLFTGKINGQSAFMGGKLRIKGNMGMAMKLGKLTEANKAKL